MKFPGAAASFVSLLVCFAALQAWGGSARIPPRLKVKLLFQRNGSVSNPGTSPRRSGPGSARSKAHEQRAFGGLPGIRSRVPGAQLFHSRFAPYLVLGGAGGLVVALGAVAYLMHRKKELEEEEEW